MTCPHCQKELPEDRKGKRCPFCGASGTWPIWPVFLCALLLPPLSTLVASAMNDDATPAIGFFGGIFGGIVCGVTIAFAASNSVPGRIVLSIVFSGIMVVVCVMLCFFGCVAGGHQML